MKKNYKSDQLVIPVSPVFGMALRETAEEKNISVAALARMLLDEGMAAIDPNTRARFQKHCERLALLSDIQLLEMKVTTHKPIKKPL